MGFALGLAAYYSAFFVYEDKERQLQNRIEQLWVAVNDRKKVTGSLASALFNKVAAVVQRAFDRVFGRNLFSLQLVGVSTCYSFAVLCFVTPALWWILIQIGELPTFSDPQERQEFVWVAKVLIISGLVFAALGTLPALKRASATIFPSLIPLTFFLSGMAIAAFQSQIRAKHAAFLSALLLSLLSNVVLLGIVRLTLRRLAKDSRTSRLLLAILIQIAIIFFLVYAPFGWAQGIREEYGEGVVAQTFGAVGALNIFTGLASSLFLLTLLFVLLHRALWPMLDKAIYPLAARAVIRNHTLMASIGTGCMVFAFPAMTSTVKSVLEWLAK